MNMGDASNPPPLPPNSAAPSPPPAPHDAGHGHFDFLARLQRIMHGVVFLHSGKHGPRGPRAAAIWHDIRWILMRLLGLAGSMALLLVLMTASAAWYTSRSQFCNSCHIMEPYYKSWQNSAHANVACIKCHFPPGFAEEVRGKMLGLVQLVKYVTASQGPRPKAEVPDASCLRSGCHETRLLSGKVDFHGISFDHSHHLGELRRGKKLRCTSCHSQIVQGSHMTVTETTCFLCHFKEGLFNEGLGACTRCHQIPEKQFDLGGGVMFTHNLAYEKGVDCANCHADLIRGSGEVPRERCIVCHNREDDLKQIGDHEYMHRIHVTDHHVNCLECHLEIQHSLQRDQIVRAVSQCSTCHPNHHQSQVAMLEGTGAKSIPAFLQGMLSVGIQCKTCHRAKDETAIRGVLWKGSPDACSVCHDAAQVVKLKAYHQMLRGALPDLEAAVARITKALETATLPADRATAVKAELGEIQHDVNFLRVANDIHNMHYASKLEETLLAHVATLCHELKIPEPQVKLPPALKELKNVEPRKAGS